MEFKKVKADIKSIELDVTRIDNDDYFEVVVKKNCLGGIIQILENIFGSPAWPSSAGLSKEIEKAIKNLGGLRSGQTLYAMTKDEFCLFAMLWPWQDGERITIKISRISR